MKVLMKELTARMLKAMYPVGTIYMSVNSANPSTYIGGTWVAWGSGRVPVGVDTSITEFQSVEKTGGAKALSLSACIGACNSNTGALGYIAEGPSSYQHSHGATYVPTSVNQGFSSWNHSTPVVETYENKRDVTNLQPYITCYMWKRTA